QPRNTPVENGVLSLSQGTTQTLFLDKPLPPEFACEVEFTYPTPSAYGFSVLLCSARKIPQAYKDCEGAWLVMVPNAQGRTVRHRHGGPMAVHELGTFSSNAREVASTPYHAPVFGRKYVVRVESSRDWLRLFLDGGLVLTARRPGDAAAPDSPVFLGLRQ